MSNKEYVRGDVDDMIFDVDDVDDVHISEK